MSARTTARPDLRRLAFAERTDLAELLDTLTPEEWAAPSLCRGWSIHDVVAHVVSYEELGPAGIIARRFKGRRRGGPNEVGRAEYARRSPVELSAFLRAHLVPTGLTSWFGGAIGLTDGLIHHQDIRRALDRPRTVPPERLRPALEFALRSPKLPSRGDAAGLHLVADDLDWEHGSGPDVAGPAEALLMAIAGRPDALTDLRGPGAPVFAERINARQRT
ncbi:maleylpyruvate isomerase family mycothiol-dependent enzyme [Pseudactinotalea sp. HY158]|uniref:maleylpyruvate isomerase family mycothiol-dependent enzyme n=1 Tax=Pseudactinotalea sp. HY158 TaxID=2654547 RepID=UPI00129D18C2|nr:maleylpyruvate isomerase family mycothiol-dependent enzyme [Pseudactinotalea sp. HY158]QGH69660.1 maleylpyruvate isomerase family mycothiol-dependent enzyme [Pseudactinotalea sp. HY158]